MTIFTLAHLSDPHLAPLPEPSLVQLMSKRGLGYINWRIKRAAIHRRDVLDALVADVKAQAYDHLTVTGDLVNLALPAEFTQARAWVQSLGAPSHVTVIPGNHDAYVRGAPEAFAAQFADYMRGDDALAGAPVSYPFVRRRGPAALVAVSSAVPTAPLMASGTLGRAQIERLATLLAQLAAARLFRVVLIHHPLHTEPRDWTKRLTDAEDLLAVLRQHGAELILHGHDHRHGRMPFAGPNGQIPAIGVPSASDATGGKEAGAAYNLYRIARLRETWQCEMISRGLTVPGSLVIAEQARARL